MLALLITKESLVSVPFALINAVMLECASLKRDLPMKRHLFILHLGTPISMWGVSVTSVVVAPTAPLWNAPPALMS